MSARRVRKKRTRLMTRRRLNALPVGGKLIPPADPTAVVTRLVPAAGHEGGASQAPVEQHLV